MKHHLLPLTLAAALLALPGLVPHTHADTEAEARYYRIDTFQIEEDILLEVGALTTLQDGRLMIGTRTGKIYILENPYGDVTKPRFTLFAQGIAQPLGLLEHDGWIYTAQRGELTRLKDTNGDPFADVYETVCDKWAISGNYHEYNFGPRLGPDGDLWVTLNKPFGKEYFGRVEWRGWAVKINPTTGKMTPMSAGLRSPAGLENAPWGDMFYTDNQGEWCNASKLSHLEFGDFHGHPHGLNTREAAGKPYTDIPDPPSGEFMKDLHKTIPMFKMPAVWFPYEKMGKSPSGLRWDQSAGKFGPFAGQLFVGDQHHAMVMRVFLEQVDGHWQGACFPFREGFQCGITRLAFGKDASLFVGMTNAGWSGRGNRPWGLQRLAWTGEVPLEIHEVHARPDGFELTFTRPVNRLAAADPGHYTIESYTYRLESRYGGPEDDKAAVTVKAATVAPDGKSVRLVLDNPRAGYVHEMHLQDIAGTDGSPMLHPVAYYTLVKRPNE